MKMFLNRLINEKFLSPLRWKLVAKHLLPYLDTSKKILDLGAGDGGLANELLKSLSIQITGVDVYPQEKTFIPVIKYDGKILPFKDNSFDLVMINDVLHHDHQPEIILNEARRVSKKFVLVKDHYWTNKFDLWLLKLVDGFGNLSYGVKMPFNFQNKMSWEEIFKAVRLDIKKQKYFRYNMLDPSRQVIFLLEK